MGCASSGSPGALRPDGQRRRLSIGNVDGEPGGAAEREADRGLIAQLNQATIIDMLGTTGDRKFSVGSQTDQGKTSFQNKSLQQIGDPMKANQNVGLGYTCRKGLKPESPNQDSWSVLQVDGGFSLYGVYDGHGIKGHDVSNFVKDNLPKLLIRDKRFKTDEMEPMFLECFKRMQSMILTHDSQKRLNAQLSGTTCTVVLHNYIKSTLTYAHVADSTAVLGSYVDGKKNALKGVALTRDHKPNLPDEKQRIEQAGGRVVFDGYANHRVYAKSGRYPGLNMSRCLGDLMGHADAGCSAVPEVGERPITDSDHVLLVCSDGVWEFVSPQEAVGLVAKYTPDKAIQAAEDLAKASWDRWIQEEGGAVVDDITVVCVYLQELIARAKASMAANGANNANNAEGSEAPQATPPTEGADEC